MDLRRLDAVIQFISATNAQLENWDTPIPNNVLMYCPETRIIKLGENKKWADTPVFIDFNVLDAINTLAQQMLPELNDLNTFAVDSTNAIVTLQTYIQQYIKDISALESVLQLQRDTDGNIIASDLVTQLNDLQQLLASLSLQLNTEKKIRFQETSNLSILISTLENNTNSEIGNINSTIFNIQQTLGSLQSTIATIEDKVYRREFPLFGVRLPDPKGYKYGVVISKSDKNTCCPCVIKDGDMYKIWYNDHNYDEIYYATSVDGINWEDHGTISIDGDVYPTKKRPSVLKDTDGTYKMWYGTECSYDNSHESICYATSSDGINWTIEANDVIDIGASGDTDSNWVGKPWVVKDNNGVFHMFYVGNDSTYDRIHYATSSDGINWTKHGVIIDTGISGSTTSAGVTDPTIIVVDDMFYMWYVGYDDNFQKRIHHARSSDNTEWSRYGVVFGPGKEGSTDSNYVSEPSALKDVDDSYKLWYTGYGGSMTRIHLFLTEESI